MQPHVVAVTRNRMGADDDGGMRVAVSASKSNLPCFVQPGQAQTIIDTSDTTGNSRVTEVIPTKVYFVNDADLDVKDLVTWVDQVGRTHVYRVEGYKPPCGTQVLWVAECKENE